MNHTPSDVAVDAALDKWLREPSNWLGEPSDWRNWKEAAEIRNQFRNALIAAYAVEPPYIAGLLRAAEIIEAGRSREFQRDAILEAAARRVRAEAAQSPPLETAKVLEEATRYAEHLAVILVQKHHPEATTWKPMSGDLVGLLTQIDNIVSGLARPTPPDTGEASFPHVSQMPTAYRSVPSYTTNSTQGLWAAPASPPPDPGEAARAAVPEHIEEQMCPMCGYWRDFNGKAQHSPTCELARALAEPATKEPSP